jgi:hypothetical protein
MQASENRFANCSAVVADDMYGGCTAADVQATCPVSCGVYNQCQYSSQRYTVCTGGNTYITSAEDCALAAAAALANPAAANFGANVRIGSFQESVSSNFRPKGCHAVMSVVDDVGISVNFYYNNFYETADYPVDGIPVPHPDALEDAPTSAMCVAPPADRTGGLGSSVFNILSSFPVLDISGQFTHVSYSVDGVANYAEGTEASPTFTNMRSNPDNTVVGTGRGSGGVLDLLMLQNTRVISNMASPNVLTESLYGGLTNLGAAFAAANAPLAFLLLDFDSPPGPSPLLVDPPTPIIFFSRSCCSSLCRSFSCLDLRSSSSFRALKHHMLMRVVV